MPTYRNPFIGQAISNIAQLFAPPSAGDMAAGAQIGLLNAKTASEKQQAGRLADLYANPNDPNFDRRAVAGGLYSPNQSYYGVDQGNATSRANNEADNARALRQTEMQEQGSLSRLYAAPITARDGETVYLPNQTAGATGLPGTLRGNISAAPGEKVFTPGGQTFEGAPKPLSESEAIGNIIMGLPPAEQRRKALGDVPNEEAIGPDGKPTFVPRPDAVGMQPAPKSPLVNIGPNGAPLPTLEPGYAWKTGPDGQPVFENGVPTAVPYPGGKAYQQQQAAGQKQDARNASANYAADVVEQDIDRALAKTGFGTAGIIGSSLKGVPFLGQDSTDLSGLLDTIGANISFDRLQAMREMSPTGAGLGQVSDFENRLLQSVYGSLKQDQSPTQLRENLQRLRDAYRYVVLRQGAPPPGIPELGPDGQPIGPPAGAPAGAPTQAAPAAAPQAGAVPAFEQMDAAGLRAWVEGNSAAIKAMSDADFQRMRARAQQLQGAQ